MSRFTTLLTKEEPVYYNNFTNYYFYDKVIPIYNSKDYLNEYDYGYKKRPDNNT